MRIFLLCALMVSVTATAGVEWKQKKIKLQVHPTQLKAEAVFPFSNTGSEPLSLSQINVNCGCMSAKRVKKSYAPGEEGSLTIMVNLRNRTGKLRKMVHVKTSDGNEHILTVEAEIPKAYEVKSPLIRWARGDTSERKTVRLHNPNAMPIKLSSITSSHKALPAELKTIREGFEYEVVVTRKSETKNLRSVIRISMEPPPGLKQSKIFKLYVFAP